MKYISVNSAKHVPYAASVPRIFFYRVNSRIAYMVIIVVAYFLTAHILLAAEQLQFLSGTAL